MQLKRKIKNIFSQKKIDLIIGPSCSGKSTYISKNYKNNPNIMAYELEDSPLPKDNCTIHYNSFRAYDNSSKNIKRKILEDVVLKKILTSKKKIKAVVLLSSKDSLIKRASLRQFVESELRAEGQYYPNSNILDLLNLIDLDRHYSEIIKLCFDFSLETELYDSNNGFRRLSKCSVEEINSAIFAVPEDYSKDEIIHITKKYHFEYHSIALPYDLKTSGDVKDFSALEQINFRSKTVLDIGCGYGALCYFAEKKGASFVMGTELKPHRYIGSILTKRILKSSVVFSQKNIFIDKLNEKFDLVFLLNVIHHLPEPFHAIKEISRICKDTFVLEFPNLMDSKFRSTFSCDSLDETLPLIGVSTSDQDQTFVFNRTAMERYMCDHIKEFEVKFYPSKINSSRLVMIARRSVLSRK